MTLEKISDCLEERLEISISATTVRKLLKMLDYSLKSNSKSISVVDHPNRDRQFDIIKKLRERFMKNGYPIISVDSKNISRRRLLMFSTLKLP